MFVAHDGVFKGPGFRVMTPTHSCSLPTKLRLGDGFYFILFYFVAKLHLITYLIISKAMTKERKKRNSEKRLQQKDKSMIILLVGKEQITWILHCISRCTFIRIKVHCISRCTFIKIKVGCGFQSMAFSSTYNKHRRL